MLLSEEIELPCGLRLPNRLCKAAMAENMAAGPTYQPNQKFPSAYGSWADGEWGMILTGNVQVSDTYLGGPGDVAISQASKDPSPETQEIWKTWAATCQRSGTPTIVQLCHPGRQSPASLGNRGFFAKAIAPSAVKLNFGPSLIEKLAVAIIFGTPREMTVEEISGKGGVVDQFVAASKQTFDAGFKGVELHGAHGYLLAQFLSPQTNLRQDDFGGSPAKRAEIVVRIIKAVREATSKEFCIGIKLNSVDASTSESLDDVIAQIRLIAEAGIDFIEISGGSYENPRMGADAVIPSNPKKSTALRESFFLEFAKTVRQEFPKLVLMVTGGFRTRVGMEDALSSGGCDLIGIGRPAAVKPKLPKEIILNEKNVSDEQAHVDLKPFDAPWLIRHFPIKQVGVGAASGYYGTQIKRMGDGLEPVNTIREVTG